MQYIVNDDSGNLLAITNTLQQAICTLQSIVNSYHKKNFKIFHVESNNISAIYEFNNDMKISQTNKNNQLIVSNQQIKCNINITNEDINEYNTEIALNTTDTDQEKLIAKINELERTKKQIIKNNEKWITFNRQYITSRNIYMTFKLENKTDIPKEFLIKWNTFSEMEKNNHLNMSIQKITIANEEEHKYILQNELKKYMEIAKTNHDFIYDTSYNVMACSSDDDN